MKAVSGEKKQKQLEKSVIFQRGGAKNGFQFPAVASSDTVGMECPKADSENRFVAMRKIFMTIGTVTLLLFLVFPAAGADPIETEAPQRSDMPPLMERYLLDELKALRTELQDMRGQMIREITDRELAVAEKVINFSNTTVTFFFYVFAIIGAGLTLFGWHSVRDLKSSVKTAADQEVQRLSYEFETRLTALETELVSKSQVILENQTEIEKTQTIHALWMQANQTPNPRTKIEIYDRILEINPQDYETMAYKADAALDLEERDWALSLCNRILETHPDSSTALYQRACAYAGQGNLETAMGDLIRAVELTDSLREQAAVDEMLEPLRNNEDFQALTASDKDRGV